MTKQRGKVDGERKLMMAEELISYLQRHGFRKAGRETGEDSRLQNDQRGSSSIATEYYGLVRRDGTFCLTVMVMH